MHSFSITIDVFSFFLFFFEGTPNERMKEITSQIIRMYRVQQMKNFKQNAQILSALINKKSNRSKKTGLI